jgi:cysteinyl-tRNA synthetase
MLKRIADEVQMASDIPDSEKETVKEAKMYFEAVANTLKIATEHLDHIYEPFSEHTNISIDSVVQNRGVLQGRYSTRVKDNFNKVKRYGLSAVRKLNTISTGDNTIRELINTFVESVGDVEEHVNAFLDIIKNDFQSPDFRDKIIGTVDNVKKQSTELDEFIYDRMIKHIDEHILTKNWMNDTRDEYQVDMGEEMPLVTRLLKEREEKINPEAFPAADKQEQSMNMSDANRMLHPNYMSGDLGVG